MAEHVAEVEVLGPWSLNTSRRFWEGFTPAALAGQSAGTGLRTVFCAEGDWRRAEVEVTQPGATARLMVSGDGDLEAATVQACRFLALDVDARGWPEVGRRDPVIGGAQTQLPGLRPCGFHSRDLSGIADPIELYRGTERREVGSNLSAPTLCAR